MQIEALDYLDGTQQLSGMLVHNGTKESRPGVVLFPDARGIGDHAIERGRRLAGLGIAVLIADLDGNGGSARDMNHAWELMDDLRSDVTRWRRERRQHSTRWLSKKSSTVLSSQPSATVLGAALPSNSREAARF